MKYFKKLHEVNNNKLTFVYLFIWEKVMADNDNNTN